MAERILKSYDPLAYHVNNVSDFRVDVVKAFKNGDTNSLDVLLHTADKSDYDVFICVNNAYHAFVLCSPNRMEVDPLKMFPEFSSNPEDIPYLLLVSQFELCFEDVSSKMYKIRWKFEPFINVKDRIKKAYFAGHFKDVSVIALQCAALGASPSRYSVLIDDCVEFSKKFCKELLKYASNASSITQEVTQQIRYATASGFSAEQLSRENKSSAYWTNSFLGGVDVSSFILQWKLGLLVLFVFLVYPFIIYWIMSG